MQAFRFDDRNVTWQTVEAIGAQIYVLAVDDARGISDVLIRFQPNTPGKLHRHVCDFSTFVLQGELRFWRPDGSLKEIRPTGSYVQVVANGEPHSEGAGDQMAIVLFSFRGSTHDMILYPDRVRISSVEFRLGFSEFKAILAHQIATGATTKLGARGLNRNAAAWRSVIADAQAAPPHRTLARASASSASAFNSAACS